VFLGRLQVRRPSDRVGKARAGGGGVMTTATTGSADTSGYPDAGRVGGPDVLRPGRGDPPGGGASLPGRDRLGIGDLGPGCRDRPDDGSRPARARNPARGAGRDRLRHPHRVAVCGPRDHVCGRRDDRRLPVSGCSALPTCRPWGPSTSSATRPRSTRALLIMTARPSSSHPSWKCCRRERSWSEHTKSPQLLRASVPEPALQVVEKSTAHRANSEVDEGRFASW
jgi:hypothetical protein